MINTILPGDVLTVLPTLPAENFHVCITSPPYFGQRDYGLPPTDWPEVTFTPAAGLPPLTIPAMSCCLGLEPEPWAFVGHLVAVFREVRRVLRDDGTCWVNLGDSYAGSWGNYGARENNQREARVVRYERHAWDEYVQRPPMSYSIAGLKPKDLIGVPWMVAKALQADGWWLRSDCIWSKPNTMPGSQTDRPTTAHEYVFLLAKNSGKPLFWTHRDKAGTRSKPAPDLRWIHAHGQELTEPPDDPNWKKQKVVCPDCGGSGYVEQEYSDGMFGGQTYRLECERCGGSIEERRKGKGKVKAWQKINLWRGHDYFYDQEAVKEPAVEAGKVITLGNKSFSKGQANGMGIKPSGNGLVDTYTVPPGRNRRTVWTIATENYKEAHFATFPKALVEPALLASTSARGCCEKCGAPWARVVEREVYTPKVVEAGIRNVDNSRGDKTRKLSGKEYNKQAKSTTTGWRPTCACGGEPVPATVLDPFFGSGTTGEVAVECGRYYVGIEMSEEYIELARKRVAGAQPALIAKGVE